MLIGSWVFRPLVLQHLPPNAHRPLRADSTCGLAGECSPARPHRAKTHSASLTRVNAGRIEKVDLLSAISRASDTEAIYTVR